MILFNYLNEEIKHIKERFYQRVKHPYVNQFIKMPFLDEDQLFLLYTMLEEKKLAKNSVQEYVLTTLLVQAALNTHETVSSSALSSDFGKKERQLTVLAGDYYSSLYYYLLAKINDITMIRLLANSIQEINESKMSFYNKTDRTIGQSINTVKTIESSLIQKVAEHFNLANWKAVASEYFFFKRLITERGRLLRGKLAPLIEMIVNEDSGLHGDNRIERSLELCDNYIFLSKSQLHALCNQPSALSSFILVRMDQLLLEAGLLKEKVAEEG